MTIKPKKINLKRLFIYNGLLLALTFGFIQYSVMKHAPIPVIETELKITPIAQGKFADRLTLFETPIDIPNIRFKTVFDKEISLDDLKGQWVILNLWATWCPPCLIEMPSLQQLEDDYGRHGIKVIAISLDRNMDGKKLRNFMNKHQFGPIAAYYAPWPVVNTQLDINGLPTTYILSPNGQAIGVYEGDAEWVGTDAKIFIESILGL